MAGMALSPQAKLISMSYKICNNNSQIWGDESTHPNITIVRQDFPDNSGLNFVGWNVANGDENLDRFVWGTFVWEGPGEDIVQGAVQNIRTCNGLPTISPTTTIGLYVPLGTPKAKQIEVRESSGQWTTTLPYIVIRAGYAPSIGLHEFAAFEVENQHSVAARAIRVRGNYSAE
jgi:hypothetical protein